MRRTGWTGQGRWSTHPTYGRSRAAQTGPSPVDRAKTGSKHHVITDGAGVPLAVRLTGGNRHNVTQLLPRIDAIPSIRGRRGRPRRRPDAVYADRAYHRTGSSRWPG